jgi:hypothetical protein
METEFSAYLSHIPGPIRKQPEMLTRIVAPKAAGSSPVGHPLGFRIGMRDTRKWGWLSVSVLGAFDTTLAPPETQYGATEGKAEKWKPLRYGDMHPCANPCKV